MSAVHRALGRPRRGARLRACGPGSSSALVRRAPGAVVTFAGVQGGAGVSTVTLLACGAVTRASDHPALAIDLAAGTRGGLGGHAGAWSQTSAENTAELVAAGGTLARPYVETADGLHVISEQPQARIAADRIASELLAETAAAVDRHAPDREIAEIARRHARDQVLDDLAGADRAAGRAALGKLVRAACTPHSLVGVDLGLADDEQLARHAVLSDLHVWVIAARRDDLEIARRRLLTHEVAGVRELVLAWQPGSERLASRELRRLGEARGCSVARLARFDPAQPWGERERACRSGLEALCRELD